MSLSVHVQVLLQFTGEEMYGRYLDLHEFHHAYVNMTGKPKSVHSSDREQPAPMDYITYVQQFTQFSQIPRSLKFQKAYMEYVEGLLRYLISFHERTQPLKSVVKLMEEVEDSFEQRWQAGEVPGWQDRAEGELPEDVDLVLDVDAFDSPAELLELGALSLWPVCVVRAQRSGDAVLIADDSAVHVRIAV
jgi:splicing factor 3A subunit 3